MSNALPKSVSQDKIGADFLSGSSGRALLFDLDKKFDEQDRLIKYLMQQQDQMTEQLASQR